MNGWSRRGSRGGANYSAGGRTSQGGVAGHRRTNRPWITEPGLWLQFDWREGPKAPAGMGRRGGRGCSARGWPSQVPGGDPGLGPDPAHADHVPGCDAAPPGRGPDLCPDRQPEDRQHRSRGRGPGAASADRRGRPALRHAGPYLRPFRSGVQGRDRGDGRSRRRIWRPPTRTSAPTTPRSPSSRPPGRPPRQGQRPQDRQSPHGSRPRPWPRNVPACMCCRRLLTRWRCARPGRWAPIRRCGSGPSGGDHRRPHPSPTSRTRPGTDAGWSRLLDIASPPRAVPCTIHHPKIRPALPAFRGPGARTSAERDFLALGDGARESRSALVRARGRGRGERRSVLGWSGVGQVVRGCPGWGVGAPHPPPPPPPAAPPPPPRPGDGASRPG